MAVKNSIEFDDGPDDDDFESNDLGQPIPEDADTSFNVDEFEDSEPEFIEVPDSVPLVTPDTLSSVKSDKDIESEFQKEINRVKKENEQELRKTKKELRKEMRREAQDEGRDRRAKVKDARREATQRRKEIRSRSVTQRIEIYSLASALGLPGYIVASLADQFLIKPEEKKAIEAEDDYTDRLNDTAYQMESAAIDAKRTWEDAIDDMKSAPIDEAAIRSQFFATEKTDDSKTQAQGSKEPIATENISSPPPSNQLLPPEPPERKQDLTPQPEVTSVEATSQPDTTKQVVDKPDVQTGPAIIPNQPTPPPRNTNPSPGTGSGNSRSGGGDGGGSSDGGSFTFGEDGDDPRDLSGSIFDATAGAQVVKPMVPKSAMPAFSTVTAAVMALKYTNEMVEAGGKNVRQMAAAAFNDNPYEGARGLIRTGAKGLDPFGINPLVAVTVEGFDTLLSLMESLEKTTREFPGASPLTLSQNVQNDVTGLLSGMSRARESDSVRAEISKVAFEFGQYWAEFKQEIIMKWGPPLLNFFRSMTPVIGTAANYFLDWRAYTGNFATQFGAVADSMLAYFRQQNKAKKRSTMQGQVLKQYSDFINKPVTRKRGP